MHSSEAAIHVPYGLAFPIEDLVLLRGWAEQRQLQLAIALDWTVDGAEFEELLIVSPGGSRPRTMTLWRTQEGVFAQTPTGYPHGFDTMQDLLDQVRPARPKNSWLQRLGLA